ncbi:hypothetical protein ACK389_31975 [Streptomyces antibioticus]|uniref:hypothetical protein n=1 Tax=Streptomyces antibioticus TaxID=1890 RepID=UPI00225202E2|nr:hypothetical protein [Streptomyces antibioticus]MCX5171280.1 hypothetical protein [Streptomyces antibioticus]
MTSSLSRGRPPRVPSHISVRVAHAVLGAAAGLVWLVLPGMTSQNEAPVAIKEPGPTASAAAAPADEASGTDLVLPVAAVGAAGLLAGYGYIRRVRRTRDRTTPGSAATPPPPASDPPPAGPDEEAREALLLADDRLRAARAELGFAEARYGAEAVAPFAAALAQAGHEWAVAARMRQRYDHGEPAEDAARRHALAGIVGRCAEAERRLDAEAEDFARLRRLTENEGLEAALAVAEERFRELAGRALAADAVLAGLRERYAPTATAAVVGNLEQAKDRLLFSTTRLNRARQSADAGDMDRAARQLRSAEGAVTQAAVFVDGVERRAGELRAAEETVPAALTGAQAELARVRRQAPADGGPPEGEMRSRLLNADAVLASVRQEITARRPYDPVAVLRRIVRAVGAAVPERGGVLGAAALLVARASADAAEDRVATHRGVVGATARTRLAEARRLLADGDPADRTAADALALEALDLAERDVLAHGTPYTGPDAGPESAAGTGGAVLGGVVPAADPESGPPSGF